MQIIFDDNGMHKRLAPLTLTRPVAQLRFGILTIAESWIKLLADQYSDITTSYQTETYLNDKFSAPKGGGLRIAGNIKPSKALVEAVFKLKDGQSLFVNNVWIASLQEGNEEIKVSTDEEWFLEVTALWHLFQFNGQAISHDFKLLSDGKTTQQLSASNRVLGNHEIFVEEGVSIECAILNATKGPIYIGKNAEIMEGSMIRGPFALCEHAVLKMGAKIYGDTTIGPFCKIGGEVSNSIFQAYSNKGHDGFVGNSLIGEWCNFGADTNTSNLKNNYSQVRVYSYENDGMKETDVTFCGVIMGDHSKTGINTMLNTATSVGVCSNIFGGGFPPKMIPSFSWGGHEGAEKFILKKAFEVAENMMKRRKVELTNADKNILTHLFHQLA